MACAEPPHVYVEAPSPVWADRFMGVEGGIYTFSSHPQQSSSTSLIFELKLSLSPSLMFPTPLLKSW